MGHLRRAVHPTTPNDPAVEAAFEAVPSEMVSEIIEGELYTMPRPRPRHARAAGRLFNKLGGAFEYGVGGPGGWTLLLEPELHLGPKPDKLVPDIAGWRRERLPESVFDEDAPGGITVPPDWVCEVISVGTERIDRGKKMRIYRREQIGHAWLVNPMVRTLEDYRCEGARWILVETYESDELVRAEPFDAVELDLGLLWSPVAAK